MLPSIFGENLFDEFFGNAFDNDFWSTQNPLYGKRAKNLMKTDVKEHDDHYEVNIDLPGFKKNEISLELKEGYLVINAAKGLDKDGENKKTGKFVRRERYAGSMSRAFYVGENLKQEDIHAKYENGVLKLNIPKAEEAKKEAEANKYIAIEG